MSASFLSLQDADCAVMGAEERSDLAVTASMVLGFAEHSSVGSLPRKGSSSETKNRAGVVMWGI